MKLFLAVSLLSPASSCRRATTKPALAGNPERGREAIYAVGCGACHTISGVPGAQGVVGPTLNGVATRAEIGGRLANTPENMFRWIENPGAIKPGVAMPPLTSGNEQTARDIVAYLYTRK